MAFQLSPGVLVTERDLTLVVPAVSTTAGAFAGAFQWGPVGQVITVDSENKLVEQYGKPNDATFKSFFTAANFLSYGNNLQINRVVNQGLAKNACAIPINTLSSITLTTTGIGYDSNVRANTTVTILTTGTALATTNATANASYTGDSLTGFTITNPGLGYSGPVIANTTVVINTTGTALATTNATASAVFTSTSPILIKNIEDYLLSYASGYTSVGPWAAKYPGTLGNSIKVSMADANTFSSWTYAGSFDVAPGTSISASTLGGLYDEIHIIVIDEDGLWTGSPGTTLEKFDFLSKARDAKKSDGSNAYYKEVINNTSKYIWWLDHPSVGTNWGLEVQNTTFANLTPNFQTYSLANGVSADNLTDGNLIAGFSEFANDQLYDISLIPLGEASSTVARSVINNVCEIRKDCIAFISPTLNDLVGISSNSQQTTNVIAYRDVLPSSSYGVMDAGYKYQYDRYNDVYRWVPMNGDIAGTVARTDFTNDPWFSPAGFNRGQIKNVVRLAFSPRQTDRDNLYKKGINPIVTFPGQGTVLFGDKTLLSKPSAFDRINVRRLFIILEKAIATAARFQLFEFNDAFTRSQFRNLVEPFLRDVQGRRGIVDFRVVCDDTNNTGEVIDRNEFVADIFIKPTRSINFIQLNFIATRTGINFEEVGA